jgi:hypothetical protein
MDQSQEHMIVTIVMIAVIVMNVVTEAIAETVVIAVDVILTKVNFLNKRIIYG